MARTKNQAARREQLVGATLETIAAKGLSAVSYKNVAETAGISERLVAYYYPSLESLVEEAHGAAVERYYWLRWQRIESLSDPVRRLAWLIHTGVPRKRDRLFSQVLNEMCVNAGRSTTHATLMTQLFDREVSLYVAVLEAGRAAGVFAVDEPVLSVARNFVALEDAYGMHLLGDNASLDVAAAEELLLSYARSATGVTLSRTDVRAAARSA